MSDLPDLIRTKDFWDVAVRPEPFLEERVGFADLDEIMNAAVVRLRGWPVPFVDYASKSHGATIGLPGHGRVERLALPSVTVLHERPARAFARRLSGLAHGARGDADPRWI